MAAPRKLAVVVGLAAAFAGSTAVGQEEAPVPGTFFETPHPELVEDGAIPNLFAPVVDAANADGQGAWIPRIVTWAPGTTVTVCFYAADIDRNRTVVAHAAEWNAVGANVTLDFGLASQPRLCRPGEVSDIRVVYNNNGRNSSLIGQNSRYQTRSWLEPTLYLDVSTLAGPFGRGIIIHEFGHALGMLHEHQKPIREGCESEINWPAMYAGMGQSGWSREKVDQNNRPEYGLASYDLVIDEYIDVQSVMMYSLHPSWLLAGSQSRCYLRLPNNEIAPSDAAVLRKAYEPNQWGQSRNSLQLSLSAATTEGRLDEARAIALYLLDDNRARQLMARYEQQQALGFNPAEGVRAEDGLDAALDELVSLGRD